MKIVVILLGIGFVIKCLIYGLENGLLLASTNSERIQDTHVAEHWSMISMFRELIFLIPTVVWTGYVVAYSKNVYYKIFWVVTVAVYVVDHLAKFVLSNRILEDILQLLSYSVLLVSAALYLVRKKRQKTESVS